MHKSTSTKDRKLGNIDLTMNALKKISDTPIFLLEDTPPSSKQIGADCLIYNSPCRTNKPWATGSIKAVSDAAVAANVISRDHIIPTDDMFCDKKHCYSMIGGITAYFNAGRSKAKNWVINSHITASFSASLALPLEEKLRAYGLIPDSKPKR